jgi:hypothetical protein
MGYSTKSTRSKSASLGLRDQTLPNHLALALIGQTVSVRRQNTISHGVVAGVLNGSGRPKLVINRMEYDLNQVLSVTPPSFN